MHQIAKHLSTGLRAGVASAAVVAAAMLALAGHSATAEQPSSATPDTPAALIAEHDCWTGSAPEGVIPGHVVATRDGATAPVYGGAKMTARALDQVFGDTDHGLTVHAFCR